MSTSSLVNADNCLNPGRISAGVLSRASQRIVDFESFVDVRIHGSLASIENQRPVAKLPYQLRTVRSEDQGTISALLKQLVMTFLVKIVVSNHDDLVDEVAIEFDRKRQSKGQPGTHPRRIGLDRHLQLTTELSEIFDEVLNLAVFVTVNPRDEAGIVIAGQAALKAASEPEGPRHAHVARNLAGRRHFDAAEQLDEGGLARAIAAKETDMFSASNLQVQVPENNLSAAAHRI